jgi:SAM-dependent methyltransferase
VQSKTLKYRANFPVYFDGIDQARVHLRAFFAWYNDEYRQSGIGFMTPAAENAWNWLVAGVRWRYRSLVRKLQTLTRKLSSECKKNLYTLSDGHYDAERYWADRHNRYRHSFRGVGNTSRSEDENLHDYVSAVGTVADLLASISFNPRDKTSLDIGCGNGFWTGILKEWGVSSYTGIDITDALFDILRNRYPTCQFVAGKFHQLALRPAYQLITMIDVTQHITDDVELLGILKRVRSLLASDGVFIVTFWNQVRPQEEFYETFRPMKFYTKALSNMAHTGPMRFRDKFITAFYNPQRRLDDVPVRPLSKESIIAVAHQVFAI